MEERDIQEEMETKNMDFGINADENAAGTTHLSNPVEEETLTESIHAELEAQKDKYLRLLAEFDNFRRRTAKENMELRQTAGKEVIVSLLEILDDCERAEKQLETSGDLKQFSEGALLIFNKLRKSLENKGLKQMDSLNEDFDVEKQEAVTEVSVPDKKQKGKVIDEIQKGYYLNNKIIRFAKVIVGK
ncbi:MAG TPA: nucleotide exchange factor GrpE [Parafilimonas sp.]|nr:nucleotide exchange factor GrpE [Parafilimonas sp.]